MANQEIAVALARVFIGLGPGKSEECKTMEAAHRWGRSAWREPLTKVGKDKAGLLWPLTRGSGWIRASGG